MTNFLAVLAAFWPHTLLFGCFCYFAWLYVLATSDDPEARAIRPLPPVDAPDEAFEAFCQDACPELYRARSVQRITGEAS